VNLPNSQPDTHVHAASLAESSPIRDPVPGPVPYPIDEPLKYRITVGDPLFASLLKAAARREGLSVSKYLVWLAERELLNHRPKRKAVRKAAGNRGRRRQTVRLWPWSASFWGKGLPDVPRRALETVAGWARLD
jgi:hypothetical protein